MQVRSLVGLWRGIRKGDTADVPDDELTAEGLARGHCERVAESETPAEPPPARRRTRKGEKA